MPKISSKKRVLFATSTFPRNENDVLAGWIGELALRLKNEGVEIEIFAPSYKGKKQVNYKGIPIHRFRYAPSFLEFLTQDEGAVIKLRRHPWLFPLVILYMVFGTVSFVNLIRKKSYDIVHIHWPIPQGFFGLTTKWFSKSKVILTFYGAEFALVRKIPFLRYFLHFIITRADSVTAISKFTAAKIKEIKKISVTIIPFSSSIDVDSHKFVKNQERKRRILFVGRLVDRKGVEFLVSAMPFVLKEIDAHLDIVGNGPLYDSLKNKISELKLDKFVTMRGSVSNKNLVDLYKKCDVFVLPAIVDKWGETEGLGVVLLEAMSFKKPVVATSVGGISDIVEDGKNGFLVPQKDSKAIASAVVKILQDVNLAERMGDVGYRLLVSKFSWKSIIEKTLYAYSRLS